MEPKKRGRPLYLQPKKNEKMQYENHTIKQKEQYNGIVVIAIELIQ